MTKFILRRAQYVTVCVRSVCTHLGCVFNHWRGSFPALAWPLCPTGCRLSQRGGKGRMWTEKKQGVNVRTHTLRSLSSLPFFPNDTSNTATQEKLAMKKDRDSGGKNEREREEGGDPTSTRLRGRFISCPTVLDINPQERFLSFFFFTTNWKTSRIFSATPYWNLTDKKCIHCFISVHIFQKMWKVHGLLLSSFLLIIILHSLFQTVLLFCHFIYLNSSW